MLFVAASAILLTWAVCAIVLIGLGSLASRPNTGGVKSDFSLATSFWAGLALAVASIEIWSLFLRISSATPIALALLGTTGIVWRRAFIFRQLKEIIRLRVGACLALALIAVYVALRASGPCRHYDTGLYGAQVIRWIETFSAVPGLANIHGRLGFDSAVFLCIATLGQGFWRGLGFHLFTGFILVAMWTAVLPAWSRVLRSSWDTEAHSADWFKAILIIPAAMWSAREQIVGAPTDVPANAICLVAAGILLAEIERGRMNSEQEKARGNVNLLLAATMFALALSFKLSTIVFAALAWVICAACLFSWNRESGHSRKWLTAAFLMPTIILLPWLARNLILTGYPFFPSALLGIPADWRVSNSAANLIASWVHSWGRNPTARVADTQGWSWFLPWLGRALRNREQFQVPALLSVGGIAAAVIVRLRSLATPEPRRWLWLLLPSLAGLAFWFAESPDPRFGAAAIWTTGATLGALGIESLMAAIKRFPPRIFAVGILIAAAWCLFSSGWQESYRPFLTVRSFISLPETPVAKRRTRSGLIVFVPARGDQCWNEPLPCTPYFDPTLRLRSPGSMRAGFRADGQAELPPN